MNIFLLHEDPEESVKMLCDKHIVKMSLESAQMLSTVVRKFFPDLPNASEYDAKDFENWPRQLAYKSTHPKHPCTLWSEWSLENYSWHWLYALSMCEEYTFRYGKVCKSELVLRKLPTLRRYLPRKGLTELPKCMPEEYKRESVVESYHEYYRKDKKVNVKPFAFTGRVTPSWL